MNIGQESFSGLFSGTRPRLHVHAGFHFLSERNQFVLIIAHLQGLHVFKLVQSAS